MSDSSSSEPTGHLPEPSGRKKRKSRQHKRKLYQKIREDLQISGDLNTTPVGALKAEQVNPAMQSDAPIPGLIESAIRQGWAVPDHKKPDLVDELIKILDDPEASQKVKVAAFNALRMADQQEYERRYPQAKSSGKGDVHIHGNVVQNNIAAKNAIREMIEAGELGLLEEDIDSTPVKPVNGLVELTDDD